MQDGNEDCWPSPQNGFASLAPKLCSGEESVARNDERAKDDAGGYRSSEILQDAGCNPDRGTGRHGPPQDGPAVENASCAPDHAARKEQQRVRNTEWKRGRNEVFDAPHGDRESSHKIGGSPPSQRPNALLGPGREQEQTKEYRDARADDNHRRDIEIDRCIRDW